MSGAFVLMLVLAQAADRPARHILVTAETREGDAVENLTAADLRVELAGRPAEVLSVTARPLKCAVVFLLDEARIAPVQLAPLRRLVGRIARDAAPGTVFSVRTSAGRVYLREASEPAAVVKAMQSLRAGLGRERAISTARAPSGDASGTIGEASSVSTQSLMRSYADDDSVDGLRHAAESFGNDARRHVIVWVTSAFGTRSVKRAERTATALFDRSVFVYAVNSAAALALSDVAFDDTAPADALTYRGENVGRFRFARGIAELSGGFMLIGGYALRGGVVRLDRAIDEYYDVVIRTSAPAGPASVTVTSLRPDLVLRSPQRLPPR